MTGKLITRIDLEKCGDSVTVRQWYEGWTEGSPADISESLPGGYIVGLLMRYEKQGFTCEMADQDTGRALRGKITRVDLIKLPDGWHYKKFPYGWTAKTRPLTDEIKTDDEVLQIVEWCQARGWCVREWPGGYRAFQGGSPVPVRDGAAVRSIRRRVESDFSQGRTDGTNKRQFDFAFDF